MIRISPIRLIDENNEQVGLVETHEAIRRAQEAGMDLVEVVADARPPVCKIMDYGKYKYDLSKKEQQTRASSKQSELKEIRFPASVGLAGHVASTGETLNIGDAYVDERFNPDIDRRTGYRTRSVLAAPVLNRKAPTGRRRRCPPPRRACNAT